MFRSCSKKVTTTSVPTVKFSRHKEVTLNGVVCFIKVNRINVDTRLNNLLQRMIRREDQLLAICLITPVVNQSRFSATEVLSFTTVNMIDCNIFDVLKKLLAKLFSKKNTRCNNNGNTVTAVVQIILNHTDGLTATSGDDDLSFVVLQHCVNRSLLMWAKGDGQVGVLFSMDIL